MVSVFHSTDYRQFLSDWIAEHRQSSKAFSLRGFSRKAGFASHSSLHLVLIGKRDLTEASVPKLAKAMRLTAKEQRFFADLVAFTQAATHHERHHYYQRLLRHARFRDAHEPEGHQLEYFSRWHYVAIREMIGLPDFREDATWISRRLKGAVTPAEVTEAIEVLLRLKLCIRDAGRKLQPANRSIATSDEVASLAVAQYHEAMIERTAEALKNDSLEQLHLSALTVPLSAKGFERVKQRLNEFRRELRALLEDEKDAEEICQINLQLIGLTRRLA